MVKSVKQTLKKKSMRTIKSYISQHLELLQIIRLYHWKTNSYSVHKATDELYNNLNILIDNFVEVLLGKTDYKIKLSDYEKINFKNINSNASLIKYVNTYKKNMENMEHNLKLKNKFMGDINNIRDEIIADLNKFLYQLRLK
jgi:DNA-binding ferritin-like protein